MTVSSILSVPVRSNHASQAAVFERTLSRPFLNGGPPQSDIPRPSANERTLRRERGDSDRVPKRTESIHYPDHKQRCGHSAPRRTACEEPAAGPFEKISERGRTFLVKDWSASVYTKFESERTRPARDLLSAVPLKTATQVVDLGCGPGNSTALLRQRFPQAKIVGVDTSADMLKEARQRLPELSFVKASAETFAPEPGTHLIFANAVLQWVSEPLTLLSRLLNSLQEGGVIAIQVPDNLEEPSHVEMRRVANSGPWTEALAHVSRAQIPSTEAFYSALARNAQYVDIWRTTYHHPLSGPDAVVKWVEGTGLRPYVDPLNEAERSEFLAAYRSRIAEAYPAQRDGKVLLRYPRLFVVAKR